MVRNSVRKSSRPAQSGLQFRPVLHTAARNDLETDQVGLVRADRVVGRFGGGGRRHVLQPGGEHRHPVAQVHGPLDFDFAKRSQGTEQQYDRQRRDHQRDQRPRDDAIG